MNQGQTYQEEVQQLVTQTLPPGTQVVVRHHPGVPMRAPGPSIEGLEDLDFYQDVTLGRWRLVQKMSDIEGKPGQWNNNLTGELRDVLELIVLRVSPSRAYFSDDRKLVCSSRDAHTSLSGRDCATCPESLWREDKEGSPEQPPCGRGFTYICWDQIDEALCLAGAMSTGVTSAKKYNGYLVHKRLPPFTIGTTFTSHHEVGAKGSWEQLDIIPGAPLSTEKAAEMRQMYRSLAGLTYHEVDQEGPGPETGPPVFDDEAPPDIDVVVEEQQPDFPF